MQSEKKQHLTITTGPSCHWHPAHCPPVHAQPETTILQSFVTSHNGNVPCYLPCVMALTKPCCSPTVRLLDVTHLIQGCDGNSGRGGERWGCREVKALHVSRWLGRGRWICCHCCWVKLELHLGSAPLCVDEVNESKKAKQKKKSSKNQTWYSRVNSEVMRVCSLSLQAKWMNDTCWHDFHFSHSVGVKPWHLRNKTGLSSAQSALMDRRDWSASRPACLA